MQTRQIDEYDWQKKFCVLPRRVEGRWVWLKNIEVRTNWYRPWCEDRRLVEEDR